MEVRYKSYRWKGGIDAYYKSQPAALYMYLDFTEMTCFETFSELCSVSSQSSDSTPP